MLKLGKVYHIDIDDYQIGFERSMTTARIPCNSIKRYPVVARWRNDVDFVAAGIFCF
jgi:alanyl-tRNA synthetase